MDAYSIHGDHYYQGYPAQAPPPGTAANQTVPPGAAPTQPSAPTSTPLVPPGVVPSPSSAAASHYGMHPPPPHGYHPSSAERWSSYPIPAAEPHPYAFYPPTVPYDRPAYGHHPYHQQDPFLHAQRFRSPPQTHMPLPPRGSDVTRFRKKRPFLPHQNLRPKNKPFKQPQENFRGGGRSSQQVKKAFDSDPKALNVAINKFPVANSTQILQPFRQGRAEEAPANRMGNKRRMDERGEGRSSRNDDRRKGDKRARPGWNKGKRKKGRKQGGDKSSMDPGNEAKGTSPTMKSVDAVPVAKEPVQEVAVWSELHRDVRRRVQEFLHTSERETLLKRGIQDTQESTLKIACGDGNAAMQKGTQEPTINAKGGDAIADIEDTQEGRQAVSGVANAETQDTQVKVDGNANAEMQDNQEAEVGDSNAEMQGTEEAMHADENAQAVMAKNNAAGQLDYVEVNIVASSQADHMCAVPSDSPDLPLASAHIDAMQAEEPDMDEVNLKKLDIVDILKTDCENAPRFATEIVQDLEVENAQECPGVDEAKCEHNNQQSLLNAAHNSDNKNGKHPETLTQNELKEREEKAFNFFTKLLEENKDLKNLYIEKCNSGAFECLMCHSKIKKRFSNLVSLVTHANNVLKTKKLPEHRGYGRAVCALLGWDPQRYPKVPKSQDSHSGVEKLPAHDVRAPLGDGDISAPVSNAVEHVHTDGAMKDGLQVDALKGVAVVNAAESKVKGDVDEIALRSEADGGVYNADAVKREPVGDADRMEPRGEVDESVPLGDTDKCAPLRDTGSSVKQESIKEVEVVDGGGNSADVMKGWKGSEDVGSESEKGNEQVGETVDAARDDGVPKSVQAGAEMVPCSEV